MNVRKSCINRKARFSQSSPGVGPNHSDKAANGEHVSCWEKKIAWKTNKCNPKKKEIKMLYLGALTKNVRQ